MKLVGPSLMSFPVREAFISVERYVGYRKRKTMVALLRTMAQQTYALWGIVNNAIDEG